MLHVILNVTMMVAKILTSHVVIVRMFPFHALIHLIQPYVKTMQISVCRQALPVLYHVYQTLYKVNCQTVNSCAILQTSLWILSIVSEPIRVQVKVYLQTTAIPVSFVALAIHLAAV